ncbi:MAG: D-alanyl-D-alanine carboxypeptidase [Parcubacteria group bacterium Gr01-1014_30]|nr:MAG: D-alanyl-D-alanine carboxypeptidase [Parcubacteria group bacterium Gr01-1014_30]
MLGFIFVVVFAGFLSYQYYHLEQYSLNLEKELLQIKGNLEAKSMELQNTILDRDTLAQKLEEEKSRMDELAVQVADITSAVGLIEKIQATDEELLQKYSRVYFLNENYVPESLTQIDQAYLYNPDKGQYLYTKVMQFLQILLQAAAADGVDLKIISAYRSFGEQASLKYSYKVTYGSGANKFSADQGYSEHQLGTTVDFTNSEIGSTMAGFDKTNTYEWLRQNAFKYGFALSYPKGNTYYYFEPWHWRFVGTRLAERLHSEGKYFYDLDQRDINTYIVSLFD